MINGFSIYSKGQMSNYFIRQFSKGKTPQNVQIKNDMISEKDGMKSPIRSVYQRIAKGQSTKTKFRTSKNSPDRLYKFQDRIRELNDESKLKQKEIKNMLPSAKVKDSGGKDYLFMTKIQKMQSKGIINLSNHSTYSNLLNHIPNTMRLDNSQFEGPAYQKYNFNIQDEEMRKSYHVANDNEELTKETKKVNCNNNNNALVLNINSACISPRLQSDNSIQSPNENNGNKNNNPGEEPSHNNNNNNNLVNNRNLKEFQLIKSKSNPNNNCLSNCNQQMYLKYSNVLMQSINKSSKGSGILLPIENTQSKLNKNLSSDIISRTTCQTKNTSRKPSAEKNGKILGQGPFIQSIEINNNIPLSTKSKSGLISTKASSSSSLIKPKDDNIYNTKQSFYLNPLYKKGMSNASANTSNANMLLNDKIAKNIQNEILKPSQFNMTSKHFLNKNEIKFIDYVTSNIKNHSLKNSSLNNKELKRKEEIDKDILETKLKTIIQQNKSLTTVHSKQNSKSTSRVEEYPNNTHHNDCNTPIDQNNNISNSKSSSNKNSFLLNANQMLNCNNKILPSGIAIKKHSLQLITNSPVHKANREMMLYHKDVLKEESDKVIIESNSEEVRQDSSRILPIKNNINDLAIEHIIGERIINETNQSMQSTVRESMFYIKEKEKICDYIKKNYESNGVYPDTQFNFYTYGRLIGKGAFGKVNLALHIGSGRLVAIKSFNKTKLKSKNAIPKIRHEISILSKLQHPFISQILDTFDTDKHIMIIMEYLCGDLLSFIRKRSKLSENSAKIIFKQLMEGLKFIHSNKIIHRDIKLDNILIDLNNTVKICDFGVSRKVNPGDLMHEHCGTPAYIAPEIFRKKGYEGYSCDIWSAGVTLYYMLSGTQPFKGRDVAELQDKVMNGKYETIKKISQEANDLIDGMLQVNPKKRLTVNQILAHSWLNGVNVEERSKINLFTKAEKLLLKKFDVNYLNSNRDEMIEYFTNRNIDTIAEEERKQKGNTKSYILAPYNSDASYDSCIFSDEIKLENSICKFDLKIKLTNMKYELNNNEEIDNGAIITKKNSTSNVNDSVESKKSFRYSLSKPISPKRELIDEIHSLSGYSSPTDKNRTIAYGLQLPSTIMNHLIKEIENTLGYHSSFVYDCLSQKKINYATGTYYLLAKDYEERMKS